jgi:hypothetical protein
MLFVDEFGNVWRWVTTPDGGRAVFVRTALREH